MGFGIDFPATGGQNPFSGREFSTSIDVFNSALENNGALQPLGSIYQTPLNPNQLPTAKGLGSNRYLKYVRYNPTVSQVLKNGPMLVYWKDETMTTVTPLASESFMGINGVAGWLLYSTTANAAAVAADINGNFVWIQCGGFLSAAWVTAAAAAGASIYGAASTAFATGTTAANTAPPNVVAGWAQAAAVANLVDLYVPLLV